MSFSDWHTSEGSDRLRRWDSEVLREERQCWVEGGEGGRGREKRFTLSLSSVTAVVMVSTVTPFPLVFSSLGAEVTG